jgi:hypothetical protein
MSWSPQQDQAIKGFYVYVHTRADTGVPFYVGKGKGDRADSRHSRNPHWRNIEKKHGMRVSIIASGLDEELAFLAEIELIDRYRRIGVQLSNQTIGGDGVSLTGSAREAFIQKMRDPDVNARRSASLSRSWAIDRERRVASLRAASSRPETKSRLRASSARNNAKPDVKAKLSNSGKAYWSMPGVKEARLRPLLAASKAVCAKRVQCVCTGEVFASFADAAKWVRETNPKASHSAIVNACKGKLKSAYGFVWRYADTAITRAAERVTVIV